MIEINSTYAQVIDTMKPAYVLTANTCRPLHGTSYYTTDKIIILASPAISIACFCVEIPIVFVSIQIAIPHRSTYNGSTEIY